MITHTILLDRFRGRAAAALLREGQLDDLIVDTAGVRPGTVYRAIADRPLKGTGGLFLRTPDGSVFLRQGKGIGAGRAVLVQVTSHAEPGKAPPVTTRLAFKSRYAIVTPGAPGRNISREVRDPEVRERLLTLAAAAVTDADQGLILRSSAANADDSDILADIRSLVELSRAVAGDSQGEPEKLVEGDGPHAEAWREWTMPADITDRPGCFAEHGVLDQIEALSSPLVGLSGGASMSIEATRALVAVDVNTGGDGSPAAALKANLAAAAELPRQLRLRGLGGQIVLDPAPIPRKDRPRFDSALKAAFRRDSVETSMAGWTTLGLVELQRKRARTPLNEVMR